MKALDTNVIIRFLLNDDRIQGRRAKKLLEQAEARGETFLVTTVVLLETLWVLSAVYELSREDVLGAVDLLCQMPVLVFENHDMTRELVRLGSSSKAHLPDLVIGLSAMTCGCETTLTFEKGLERTGLFERA